MNTDTDKEQSTDETMVDEQNSDDGFDGLTVDSVNMDVEQSADVNTLEDDTTSNEEEDQTDENQSSESSTDETDDSDSGSAEEEATENTSSEQETTTDDSNQNEEEGFTALSEETGVQISSDDELVSSLKELASLRKSGGGRGLSKSIQEAIKVEKQGGNLAEHFARTGMDFDKMDDKEVLRQNFFKEQSKLHGSNPKLANMKFERDFSEKYGKWMKYQNLSEEDKKDFADDNDMENIEYEKMMFENDAQDAKGSLNQWKEEVAPVADASNTMLGMTEKEADLYAQNYSKMAQASLDNFEAVNIQMGEGIKDFSLGVNETTKPLVEGWAKNPSTFLKDIGFDGKEIDVDRLLPIMTLIAEASVGTLGERIGKYIMDDEDVDTFKNKLQRPSKTTTDVNQKRESEGDMWDKIGDAAEEARQRDDQDYD